MISWSYPCGSPFLRVGCSDPMCDGLIFVAMTMSARRNVPSSVRFLSQLPIQRSVSAP